MSRLDFLPESLFRLPSLTVLDVSNNKLQHLPKELWMAPKLKELNASFNMLRDLPDYLTRVSSKLSELSLSADFDFNSDSSSSTTASDVKKSTLSEEDHEDARMMRSIHLATINITRQDLTHHRYLIFSHYSLKY